MKTTTITSLFLFGAAFAGCTSVSALRDEAVGATGADSAGKGAELARYESADLELAPMAPPAAKCETPLSEGESPDAEVASSEQFTDYGVRPFVDAAEDNLSTFSIDVDTGSYTISRRLLREGRLPPASSVRVEEFVNFFRQHYAGPKEGAFALHSEAAASPFRAGRVLLRVGLQGRRLDHRTRKPANLVFLIDTSGSMQSRDKIGLLKRSLSVLVENLSPQDRVSICTYAGSVRKILDPTSAAERGTILRALSRLRAGGSTAMASGIDLAYRLARAQAGPGVTTRVIVCSDGDANVGATSHEEILKLIHARREAGITLGTVGFGMGNYKDTMMEQLANRGNGSYAYVDSIEEANRIFGEELVSNLETIARDVKLQVAFDPARVRRYRLLGYENRAIHDDDFRRDEVDAGEVGAGHSVTALYELELVEGSAGPLGEVRLRHKPGQRLSVADERATEARFALSSEVASRFTKASQRFRFVSCVAEFAEVLRKSPHTRTGLRELAELTEASLDSKHDDREHEFLRMIQRAAFLAGRSG
jgi:Ca-activated chloride channel homolog